jgi:hypothetical protein
MRHSGACELTLQDLERCRDALRPAGAVPGTPADAEAPDLVDIVKLEGDLEQNAEVAATAAAQRP